MAKALPLSAFQNALNKALSEASFEDSPVVSASQPSEVSSVKSKPSPKQKKQKVKFKSPPQVQLPDSTAETATMSRRRTRRRVSRNNKRRRARRTMGYLRPISLPVRYITEWTMSTGATHYEFIIKLDNLIGGYSAVYSDFRCLRLNIRYITNNADTAQGVSVGLLTDGTGLGKPVVGKKLFPILAAMPGSKLFHRNHDANFHWRPTEPSEKEWLTKAEAGKVLATLYIADNSTPTVEFGGVLVVSGTLLCRGRYNDITKLFFTRAVENQCLCSMELGSI